MCNCTLVKCTLPDFTNSSAAAFQLFSSYEFPAFFLKTAFCTVYVFSLLYCSRVQCTVLFTCSVYCTVHVFSILYCSRVQCTVLFTCSVYCTVHVFSVLYCSRVQCTVLFTCTVCCTSLDHVFVLLEWILVKL